ncbi:uroporphyrinogen-III C-methyltransferase [Succinimonas amylolytica]|uniref:uroporphyrinogen-III C-methyltransferase n=1 Tax=Succinimonas amylolytica TaxID=83769 RepID=UPI0003614499|nr:uroporphyrinogen-III C-methyltransferase [Succinimonas amylolytica]
MSEKKEIIENELENAISASAQSDMQTSETVTTEIESSSFSISDEMGKANSEYSDSDVVDDGVVNKNDGVSVALLEKSVKRLRNGMLVGAGLGILVVIFMGGLWIQNAELNRRPVPKNYDSAIIEIRTENQELQNQLNRMLSSVKNEFQSDIRSSESRVIGQVNNLRREQERISQDLRELRDRSGRKSPDEVWQLYEAVFLINIADRKVLADQDYVTARTLLQNADELIKGLDDPRARDLRASLAKDINVLGNMPRLDREGMMLRLQELVDNVSLFPLKSLKTIVTEKRDRKGVSEDFSEWRQNLMNSVEDFMESFITVRKKQPEDPELMDFSNEAFLRENIKSYFLTAQVAFYRGEISLFQKSLERADFLIARYFDNADKVVMNTREQIRNSLVPMKNVTPPTHLESQVTMRNYLKLTDEKEQ